MSTHYYFDVKTLDDDKFLLKYGVHENFVLSIEFVGTLIECANVFTNSFANVPASKNFSKKIRTNPTPTNYMFLDFTKGFVHHPAYVKV